MAKWTDAHEWQALRDGSLCPICSDDGPTDILAELETTWVTAPQLIPLPGYLCVVSKRHVVEPFELSGAERHGFWDETLRVAAAVEAEFKPVKMNYEIHGNSIPHLHVHLLPRFQGDPFEDGPIDFHKHEHQRSPEERDRLRRMIKTHF